jgi:hypothetical protein
LILNNFGLVRCNLLRSDVPFDKYLLFTQDIRPTKTALPHGAEIKSDCANTQSMPPMQCEKINYTVLEHDLEMLWSPRI